MKHLTTISAVLASLLASADLHSLPEDWEVDLAAQPPQVFTLQRPRGETYELKAVLKRHGKPFEPAITNACIYWQTNGMENLYWSAPASVSNNVLRAYWLPEMDPGAATVRGYIGDPGHIYAAAFQFRFIASPGADPNTLPLPVPVIDFAKVRVLNPPWEGGGGGGVNTNAVIDIIHKTVDGAARPLPPYLHALDFDYSYPDAAADYYAQRQGGGAVPAPQCSAVRSGNFLSRNFDYPFDDRAEFVVKMSAGPDRFASVGVAQVGTNLTEQMVTSGKPEYSRLYKWLPGATVDGINEHGVVAEINVVDGDPQTSGWHTTGDLHPLAAVRWALDHATNAQHAAEHLAANIRFPEGWQQNFHYMIADETSTYIVENGEDHLVPSSLLEGAVMTNFRLYGDPKDTTGEGQERYIALTNGANITSQWWTLTYTPDGYRASDLPGITGSALTQLFDYWASKPREQHRGETFHSSTSTSDFDSISWWQTVHTSVYDITNRVLRVAVQEQDDWYVFALPSSGTDEAKVRSIASEVVAPVASQVSGLQSSKADKATTYTKSEVDAKRLPNPQSLTFYSKAGTLVASYDGSAAKSVTFPTEGFAEWLSSKHPALGENSSATGDGYSVALGVGTVASGEHSAALGAGGSRALGKNALAVGNSVEAQADNSTAIGYSSFATAKSSTAIGGNAYANGERAHAAGWAAIANGLNSTAVGNGTKVDYGAVGATAIGSGASVGQNATNAVQIGYGVNNDPETIQFLNRKLAFADQISNTDTGFSNAVLAVGLNIDTNAVIAVNNILADTNVVAVIGEIAGWPVDPTTGATTIGSLLAALAAAVYFLKRKTSLLESGGKASDGFTTDLMEKQVAKEAVNDLIEDKIEDSTTSISTTDALSANMGKELQDQIQNLKQRGRYLSIWNCTTGLAETEPTVNPYPYKAGDYFIVGTVGATNYRPNGTQYDKNTASTTPETATVLTNDTYYYDGTSWSLLHTPMPSVPTEYLKGATATDNSLTVTKQDNTQVSLTVNYEYAVGAFGSSIASGEIRTIAPITLTVPVTLNLGNSATKSADCALWVDTSDLSSDVTLSLSSNYNYYGDTGYQTMTKGKHILVTFLRLNATDVIVTKKEY